MPSIFFFCYFWFEFVFEKTYKATRWAKEADAQNGNHEKQKQ